MTKVRDYSRTALMVAAYRGRASAAADPVCDDPWASALAGDEGRALAERYDAVFGHMTLWMGLRTRFLDDAITHELDSGAAQVVLLGAGLDTRAARLARAGVRFFEVDHPASRADKLARIGRLSGYPSAAAVSVACDFEHDDFLDRLTGCGLDPAASSVFVWEGVTYYLPEAAVRATAARVARGTHPETRLLFDFVTRRMGVGSSRLRPEDEAVRGFVKDLGEPIRFGSDDPTSMLLEVGFRHVRTLTFEAICATYTDTWDRDRQFRFQSVALATRGTLRGPWG